MIYVDADACPVKDEVIRVAERYGLPVRIVCNGGIRPIRHPLVEMAYVASGADAADDWIASRIGAGDVCVTSDVLLAGRCVNENAVVLKPNGDILDAESIGMAVATRNLLSDLRETSGAVTYNAEFTRADRSRFLQALDKASRTSG